jgi:hypothetical protein
MKRFLTRCLILGLAVLPAQAMAQSPVAPTGTSTSAPLVMPADTKDLKPVPAADCTPAPVCVVRQPDCESPARIMGFAEYLYWSVHDSNVAFAQPFDGVDPFNSVPRGPVAQVAPRYENGFRVGAGVAICQDSWVVGTYTYFRDTSSASINAPFGDVLHSNLAFPNTVNSAGDSLSANAKFDINLQMADVDYKWNFLNCEHLSLTFLAGARYGHLDQNLNANYVITGTTTVNSNINFDGGGPRTGLEGEYKILGGFYGYGKGTANLLAGQFSGSYTERNIFTGLVGDTSIKDERIVPVLEMELGFGWQSCNGRVRVSAGYYVGSWFNMMTIPSLANSIQNDNFTRNANNLKDTMTFDGLVGRVEFRF